MSFGSYILFDKDDGNSDEGQWITDMASFIPDFNLVDKIIVPSNSSRVGLKNNKWHCYVKIKDSMDLEDFGGRLLSAGNSKGHDVDKIDKNGKPLARIITDCAVYSSERVIFDGKPTVTDIKGNDVTDTIVKTKLVVEVNKYPNFIDNRGEVNALDTTKVKVVKGFGKFKRQVVKMLDAKGKRVKRTKSLQEITYNYDKLKMDTQVKMKLGREVVTKTMKEVVDENLIEEYGQKTYSSEEGHGKKLRCQSTFDNRNSKSWNGILTLDKGTGRPQLFDNGCPNRTMYRTPIFTERFTESKGRVSTNEMANAGSNTEASDTVEGEFELGIASKKATLYKDSTFEEIDEVLWSLVDMDNPLYLELQLKEISDVTGLNITVLRKRLKQLSPKELPNSESQATALINIGKSHYLFHDSNNEGYAGCTFDGIKYTVKIKSGEYKELLTLILHEESEKAISSTAISDALNTLEALAKLKGKTEIVAIRSYKTDDAVFIDRGDKNRSIIQVDKTGWRLVQDAPVKFIRKKGMLELPMPVKNGSDFLLLKKYMNIKPGDFPLVYTVMLCALAGVKPYPILAINGERGTGKSSLTRLIVSLVTLLLPLCLLVLRRWTIYSY